MNCTPAETVLRTPLEAAEERLGSLVGQIGSGYYAHCVQQLGLWPVLACRITEDLQNDLLDIVAEGLGRLEG